MPPAEVLFSFDGRIGRKTYWLYHLFVLSLSLLTYFHREDLPIPILLIVLPLFTWTGLAMAVKRWHDRGKSGWWVLIGLIPIVGALWSLIELGFLEGTPGPNEYDVRATRPHSPHPILIDAITIHCWRCKAEIAITPEMRGKETKCSSCGTRQACPA